MKQSDKIRIGVIVSHPIQYHAVIWRTMAAQADWDVEVLFCSNHGQNKSFDKEFGISFRWDVDLTEGYNHKFFKNSRWACKTGFFKFVNWGIIKKAFVGKYDYIYIHGIGYFTHLSVLIFAKFSGKKVIYRNISNNLGLTSKLKSFLKKLFYVPIYALVDAVLVIGKHNASYYREYKVPDEKQYHVPHLVDNQFFRNKIIKQKTERANLYLKYGLLIGDQVILFSGKLIAVKQPLMLISAFLKAQIPNNWKLMFVGRGSLEELMEQHVKVYENIQSIGFLNQSKIHELYNIAEILVLPSLSETWGLVVNEALNFSCAIIASDRVGCAPDIVKDKTGLVFSHNKEQELTASIEKLVNNDKLREEYQANAISTVDKCSVEVFIKTLRKVFIDLV